MEYDIVIFTGGQVVFIFFDKTTKYDNFKNSIEKYFEESYCKD